MIYDELKDFSYLLYPHKTNLEMKRIGTQEWDGGYVVPIEIIKNCDHLINCGVGYNWDFEIDFHNLNDKADIIMIDGTIDPPSINEYERMSFIKKNVGIETNDTTISLNDYVTKPHTLLKCDIEGFETDCFKNLNHSKFDNIDLLILEIHLNKLPNKDEFILDYSQFLECINILQKIEVHMNLIHTHFVNGNYFYTYTYDKGWFHFPLCYELTFVNKKIENNTELEDFCNLPSEMDKKTFYNAEDVNYTFLRYEKDYNYINPLE